MKKLSEILQEQGWTIEEFEEKFYSEEIYCYYDEEIDFCN